VAYRTVANCLGALLAAAAGALYSLWLRYTGPDTTLSFNIMIDLLLMVVIGGMGTLYGAAIGAALFVVAQNYLQDLMKLASTATQGIPLLPDLLHPDRWLLWLGVLFVVCVYYFPAGIVGRLRA
jgi:branched-chain amino acid transport system permease protein